jgi:hypothetical protein
VAVLERDPEEAAAQCLGDLTVELELVLFLCHADDLTPRNQATIGTSDRTVLVWEIAVLRPATGAAIV